MSVRIMSWVWANGPEDQGELLVMLALADFCNDEGECWPAMTSVARKARITERGARKIIRRLEEQGRISVTIGGGRRACNAYRIVTGNPEPETRNHVPPEPRSPGTGEQKPGTRVQKTRNPGSPEPSGTIRNRQCSRAREASPDDQQEGANPSPGAVPETAGAVPPSTEGAAPHQPGAVPDQTTRERLLAAMGAADGIAGPSAFLGSITDMAEARRWADLGLTLDEQCRLIAERMARGRSKSPSFAVSRFSYFTPAMADLAEAKRAGAPPPAGTHPDARAAKIDRWRKIAAGA